MKGALLKGKRVAKVHQSLFENTNGNKVWSIDAIEFTDGSFIQFVTIEGDGSYGLAPVYPAIAPARPTP